MVSKKLAGIAVDGVTNEGHFRDYQPLLSSPALFMLDNAEFAPVMAPFEA